MTINQALEVLFAGGRIRRRGWAFSIVLTDRREWRVIDADGRARRVMQVLRTDDVMADDWEAVHTQTGRTCYR